MSGSGDDSRRMAVLVLAMIGVIVAVALFLYFRQGESEASLDGRRGDVVAERAEKARRTAETEVPTPPAPSEEETGAEVVETPDPVRPESEPTGPSTEPIPVEVDGRAIDIEGQPVPGAQIRLAAVNGSAGGIIAEAVSDEEGWFRFVGVGVEPQRGKLDFGTIVVFGTAPGFGFAWHGMRMMYRGARPADRPLKSEVDRAYFRGESARLVVVFRPAATLEGRVVDEVGQPVADVEVEMVGCDPIDREGLHPHVNFREFWGLDYLEEGRRTARTDGQGRFSLHELPREVLLTLRVTHPERAGRWVFAVTTDRDPRTLDLKPNASGAEGVAIERSPLRIVMPTARAIRVRCLHPESGATIPEARVSARLVDGDRSSAYGRSDPNGELVLQMPLGRYRITLDPPPGSELVRTRHELEVTSEAPTGTVDVTFQFAAIVEFEARDAVTDAPISGVSFEVRRGGPGRAPDPVQSNPSIVDHPKTDAEGKMRALLDPGEVEFRIGWSPVPGYRMRAEPQTFVLEAGKTTRVRFALEPE
ncbi:MAG: carboxypeptidase regulatory-like domain-containing protein [Planctomycetota bacterium]